METRQRGTNRFILFHVRLWFVPGPQHSLQLCPNHNQWFKLWFSNFHFHLFQIFVNFRILGTKSMFSLETSMIMLRKRIYMDMIWYEGEGSYAKEWPFNSSDRSIFEFCFIITLIFDSISFIFWSLALSCSLRLLMRVACSLTKFFNSLTSSPAVVELLLLMLSNLFVRFLTVVRSYFVFGFVFRSCCG